MAQLELFDLTPQKSTNHPPEIVNTATVPHRSPFRYPGGKTWLIPKIRQWLYHQHAPHQELIEPFAGGATVSLTAIFENLVDRVTLVEKDEDVAAVWSVILNGGAEWLGDAIMNFQLTPESARHAIAQAHHSLEAHALATLIKNRVNRGGILAKGASFVQRGENGKGITSRWYPETLRKRILAINQIRHRIKFINGDAFEVCIQNIDRDDAIFFIDPPYVKAGRRLYHHSEINHQKLFALVHELKGHFLMTYDNNDEIQKLAHHHNFEVREISMKSTHHARKTELIIGKNLRWLGKI